MNNPSKKHQNITFIKSVIRFAGYACLPYNIMLASTFLVLAEIVGIIEEMV